MAVVEIITNHGREFVGGVPIELLQLSPRSYNALLRSGIGNIDELFTDEGRFRHGIRRVGEKAMDEIRTSLYDGQVLSNIKRWQKSQTANM